MTTYFKHREAEALKKLFGLVDLLQINQPAIFDIGANRGQSVELFCKAFPGCQTYSFEPNPAMFDQLLKQYGSSTNNLCYQMAFSDCKGVFPFNITRVPEASSLLAPDPKLVNLSKDNKYEVEVIDVSCDTIDNFCSEHGIDNIDLLKVDVQGAELKVLKGAAKTLQNTKVKIIYTEINFAETYSDQVRIEDLLSFCQKFDYYLWDIAPFLYTRTGRLWYANMILLHQSIIDTVEASFK